MENIEKIKNKLAKDMEVLVKTIIGEYGEYIQPEKLEFLKGIKDYNDIIKIKDTNTISMFANNREIILPLGAQKYFKYFKYIPLYGAKKNHSMYKPNEILNDHTYYDYINHVLLSGMSLYEFYLDTLLHETMHFCGSGMLGTALSEGLNELKTRQLAQKYNLRASRCGYPKETNIAFKLEQMLGEEITNQIAFAKNEKEVYEIIQKKYGDDIAQQIFTISEKMNKELHSKYNHANFNGIFAPFKKASAYKNIDYDEVNNQITDLENNSIKK